MANVKIDISVDMQKLMEIQPKGGEITDQSIIQMTQTGGHFDAATQNTPKLITKAEVSSKIKWKIKSKNTSDNLDLIDYVGDSNMLKVFKNKPSKKAEDEFDGDIQDQEPSDNIITEYTFTFCNKKNPSIIWNWDPEIVFPYPPK